MRSLDVYAIGQTYTQGRTGTFFWAGVMALKGPVGHGHLATQASPPLTTC